MTFLVNNSATMNDKRVEFYDNGYSEPTTSSIRNNGGYGLSLISESYDGIERPELPIDAVRDKLVEILKHVDTCIIVGETGSGKSTQVPQLCLEAGLDKNGKIGVTQPRRVAALALAHRVAEEQEVKVGKEVGYRYRFVNETSDETKIIYCTDGILLREAVHDSFLSDFSTIIIDEAHERSIHTDILLYLVRLIARQRKDAVPDLKPLKVIIMSATIQGEKFSRYFDNAPIYYIEGRTYPVELFYANSLSLEKDDYVYNTISTVLDLHESEPIEHDFLVFLTGQEEIVKATKMVNDEQKRSNFTNKIHPVGLYSAQDHKAQQRAFAKAPQGFRKVIFSTNIAETSLTIPGIRVVIDAGKVKQKNFTPHNRMEVLRVKNISKAQAIQRAGRAGREAPGKCYRLYSNRDYDKMEETTTPEILRSNLAEVILELAKIGMKSIDTISFMDPLTGELKDSALDLLEKLNAIKVKKREVKGKIKRTIELTDLGNKLADFPVDPSFSRILLAAEKLGCLEEALIVVAFISSEDVYQISISAGVTSKDSENVISQKFNTNEGDHIKLLNIYRAYKTAKKRGAKDAKDFCKNNWIVEKRMNNVLKARKQLHEICTKNKYKIESCGQNTESLRQAIAHGLFLNACEYDPSTNSFRLIRQSGLRVKIHPSSCLFQNRPRTIVFTELVKTTENFARGICLVNDEWIRNALDKEKGLLSK